MSDVNKQFLDALKELVSIVEIHSEATDNNFAWAELSCARQAIAAAEQAQQDEPMSLVNEIQYLWQIIDDIDTYGDMAKSDDKLFRSLVEKRQKDRWKTGITTDGYVLTIPAAQPPAVAVPDGVVRAIEAISAAIYLADSSCYLPILWDALRFLSPEIAAIAESDPRVAWERAGHDCAMLAAAKP